MFENFYQSSLWRSQAMLKPKTYQRSPTSMTNENSFADSHGSSHLIDLLYRMCDRSYGVSLWHNVRTIFEQHLSCDEANSRRKTIRIILIANRSHKLIDDIWPFSHIEELIGFDRELLLILDAVESCYQRRRNEFVGTRTGHWNSIMFAAENLALHVALCLNAFPSISN